MVAVGSDSPGVVSTVDGTVVVVVVLVGGLVGFWGGLGASDGGHHSRSFVEDPPIAAVPSAVTSA